MQVSSMTTEAMEGEAPSVSELLRTMQDTSDCSLRIVKCNAIRSHSVLSLTWLACIDFCAVITVVLPLCRQFVSALHENQDLQATVLQLCSAGTQGASDISTIIILAADTATMQPAALSESLSMFHTIVRLCSVFHAEHQSSTQNFIDNLMAHVMLPSLMSHIVEASQSLPEANCAADMGDGHSMVLSWIVLVWQCCEYSTSWCNALPDSVPNDAASIRLMVNILLSTACAFKLPAVTTIMFRFVAPQHQWT